MSLPAKGDVVVYSPKKKGSALPWLVDENVYRCYSNLINVYNEICAGRKDPDCPEAKQVCLNALLLTVASILIHAHKSG